MNAGWGLLQRTTEIAQITIILIMLKLCIWSSEHTRMVYQWIFPNSFGGCRICGISTFQDISKCYIRTMFFCRNPKWKWWQQQLSGISMTPNILTGTRQIEPFFVPSKSCVKSAWQRYKLSTRPFWTSMDDEERAVALVPTVMSYVMASGAIGPFNVLAAFVHTGCETSW